ncbi:unnamed protein product [Amoebophrya sp. A120]|nr:unnamed protein product [Amoebophrya sp. A120]|eukprot:GSA120T00002487001.1
MALAVATKLLFAATVAFAVGTVHGIVPPPVAETEFADEVKSTDERQAVVGSDAEDPAVAILDKQKPLGTALFVTGANLARNIVATNQEKKGGFHFVCECVDGTTSAFPSRNNYDKLSDTEIGTLHNEAEKNCDVVCAECCASTRNAVMLKVHEIHGEIEKPTKAMVCCCNGKRFDGFKSTVVGEGKQRSEAGQQCGRKQDIVNACGGAHNIKAMTKSDAENSAECSGGFD